MDRTKVHNLDDCLSTIKDMEKICEDKFKPRVCINLQAYYLNYCYKTFENKTTTSGHLTSVPMKPL